MEALGTTDIIAQENAAAADPSEAYAADSGTELADVIWIIVSSHGAFHA